MTEDVKSIGREPLAGPRYTGIAMLLHWITAALALATVAVAWIMISLPPTEARTAAIYQVHKSLGLTIWLLVVARLAWRLRHPAPPLSSAEPLPIRAAAATTHGLLYLVFFAMPVSGYVMSAASGHGVRFWGLPLPDLPADKAVAATAMALHVTGQWAVYALVLLHLAGVVWHVAVKRDGTLERMLPPQRIME